MTELRQSPLHAEHEKLGASFTAFGPWTMPRKYGKELEKTGLFAPPVACSTSLTWAKSG